MIAVVCVCIFNKPTQANEPSGRLHALPKPALYADLHFE